MLVDLAEEALWSYRSQQAEPADFDSFWTATLASSAQFPLDVRFERFEAVLRTIEAFEFEFSGFQGDRIRGWLLLPAGAAEPLPATVKFIGYGGGRGHVLENLVWPSAGYAHIVMDTRGQGGVKRAGVTSDSGNAGPSSPGVMTRGLESQKDYYYRRLIVDAVRCVEAARELPMVDPSRVAAVGRSQGGGLALAVAGLDPKLSALITQVPFLCDMARAIRITNDAPYSEIVQFLATHRAAAPRALETLSYFDGANFANRATAPAWFSAGLMDSTCPPSTVFGAFHRYRGQKDMKIWEYNGHEGGDFEDEERAVLALNTLFEIPQV